MATETTEKSTTENSNEAAQQDSIADMKLDQFSEDQIKQIQQMVDNEVSGLRNKNSQLLAKLSKFKGVDPDEYAQLKEQATQAEESQLSVDELLEKRTSEMKRSFDEQLSQLTEFNDNLKQRALNDEIRKAATDMGVIQHAQDDAILNAHQLFKVDEKGQVVPKVEAYDDKGELLTVSKWLTQQKEAKPHWFSTAKGSGLDNKRMESNSAKQWKSNMTPQEKVAYLQSK